MYSCKSLQNITWLFLYSLLQHFDAFSIFLLLMTISTFFEGFSRLKQTKTEQTNLKDCSVQEFKTFWLFTIIGYTRTHLRTTYPLYWLHITHNIPYVIWMKVLFVKKRNGFCLETPCFFMVFKYFLFRFFFSVWVKKRNSFCLV